MHLRQWIVACATALSFVGVPTAASATIVSGTWTFTAGEILGAQNVVLDGSFTGMYDDSANASFAVTVNYLHLFPGYTGTVGGNYFAASDTILFGFTPVGSLTGNTNDFRLQFSPATAPVSETFLFTRVGSPNSFSAQDVSVTFTPTGSNPPPPPPPPGGEGNTVPEPGTLLLAGAGLAALALRRR